MLLNNLSTIMDCDHIPIGHNYNVRVYIDLNDSSLTEAAVNKWHNCSLLIFQPQQTEIYKIIEKLHQSEKTIKTTRNLVSSLIKNNLPFNYRNIYYFPYELSNFADTYPANNGGAQKFTISLNAVFDLIYSHADPTIELLKISQISNLCEIISGADKYLHKILYVIVDGLGSSVDKEGQNSLFIFDSLLRLRGFRILSEKKEGRIIYRNEKLIKTNNHVEIY